jgi:hypothetical protein
MSILFRKEQWLTLARLTVAWGRELANGGDADQSIRDLGHILLTDILNGHLDESGPLREDQRSGLRLVTPEYKAGIIQGHHVRDLLKKSPISQFSNHILVMKEAALDFAKRHEIPPPSWWTEGPSVSIDSDAATSPSPVPTSTHSARPRGRRPKKLDRAKEAMREDIRLGQLTAVALRDMTEENLAFRYHVSRDTARKARDAVLSEMPSEMAAHSDEN